MWAEEGASAPISLGYIDSGNASSAVPLLLLHGFTGRAVTHMRPLINWLAPAHRVIAPDLRGYGASQPPARDFPINFYTRDADDAAALLDTLDDGGSLPPVVVLGFSDGAESALLLAARHPDLVRGVVAWGVSGVISRAMVDAVEEWLPVEAWSDARADWREEIIREHGAHQFPSMVEGWVAGARAIHAAGGNICLREAADVQCPVLLINGTGEIGNTPEDVHRLIDRLPNGRLELVADSGHAVHEEQPERFRKLVEAFLDAL